MTMTMDRQLESQIARLRAAACGDKVQMSRKAAQRISVLSHDDPTNPMGKVEAYRCPFAAEHDDPDLAWHVGHAMSMGTLRWMAGVLRARSGNAPGPVDRHAAERIGRPNRRRQHR
jgi:hypothetical protein